MSNAIWASSIVNPIDIHVATDLRDRAALRALPSSSSLSSISFLLSAECDINSDFYGDMVSLTFLIFIL